VLAIALFVIVGGGIVFGGPLASGAFWLTLRAAPPSSPTTLPWLRASHSGAIEFASGLYVRTDDDLIVQGGELPIVVRRTYRSEDEVSRAFGVGASHNGEWYLRGDAEHFQWVQLVLENGAGFRYDRTSRGSSHLNAMFQHTTSQSVFYGSRIGWTGFQWALRWYGGSVAIFRACDDAGADRCAIVELRNPSGHAIHYVRDKGTHTLRKIRSGAAEVSFDYDDEQRVVRVRDSERREIDYAYDEGGRLTRVRESGGTVRQYTYDSRGAMLTIDEPRWHIVNAYDAGGRCVRQVTRWPNGESSTLDVTYTVRNGSIVEASKSWNQGPRTLYRFNDKHYLESEHRDPTGPAPVVIHYGRNAFSGFSIGVTVRCYDAEGRELRKAEAEDEGEEATDKLVWRTCGSGR
jgi:YD repeat-containing protein